ncbi:hypothetical protein ACFQO7_06535 [Catellatospora aurea]|uniref:Uncharacterized protein n=1 Tax=Catellatospora aurea TaxID=1337874 RepID=A0ABW2GQA4_9ACTN
MHPPGGPAQRADERGPHRQVAGDQQRLDGGDRQEARRRVDEQEHQRRARLQHLQHGAQRARIAAVGEPPRGHARGQADQRGGGQARADHGGGQAREPGQVQRAARGPQPAADGVGERA